ncbi:MAG: cyclophilin-like fold protein [Candidatus Nezhaarchaeota archaeon]|nr:cyclophilin-like fold protein [Candidatus Nezhaarchaeota archaeon]
MTELVVFKSRSIGEARAKVVRSENPVTADAVLRALPLRGRARRWGDEVYFKIPLALPEENSRVEVKVGEVAYWPEGQCVCIFFGKTPISTGDEPRAYSPVNVFAKLIDSPARFKSVKSGEVIAMESSG